MTVQELYNELDADLSDALTRLMREELVARFVVKFLDDPEYNNLKAALNVPDWEGAFRAVHSLKGVSANLGLKVLSQKASVVTELLRSGQPAGDISSAVNDLDAEYDKTIRLLNEFKGN